MNTREVTRHYRLSKWAQLIQECHRSGKTIAQWCDENNINQRQYYYWLKRVREAACNALPALNAQSNPFVPVEVDLKENKSHSEDQTYVPEITLRIGTVTMEIHNNASMSLIETTLRAIQNAR